MKPSDQKTALNILKKFQHMFRSMITLSTSLGEKTYRVGQNLIYLPVTG